MTTRIVTDSTCDLPLEAIDQFGIRVIPNYINIGDESFLDGPDMSHEAFYEGLAHFPAHPKTSAPGAGVFEGVYRRLAEEGAAHILSIHIHSGLSGLSNAARIAAQAMQNVEVTVMEVGQLALGLGYLALSAAQAAQAGKPVDEIIRAIQDQDRRTFTFAALDTMEYLGASGRAPGLLVGIATLLRIKPIIQLHQGIIKVAGKARTASRSADWLMSSLAALGQLDRLAVLHTHARGRAEQLLSRIQAVVPFQGVIPISEATPILGVHVGPQAIGLVCVKSA